jgi:hypothetical protein
LANLKNPKKLFFHTMLVTINYDIYLIQNKIQLLRISFKLFYYRSPPINFPPNFTLDSVADGSYRGKWDGGGFLIFEWTLIFLSSLIRSW